MKKFFLWLVMACFAGNTFAAPFCNIGANPWWENRPKAENEYKYRITTPPGMDPRLIRTMDGNENTSGTCALKDGEIIVVQDGFDTTIEHPELKPLPSDSVFERKRKLKQYPWILRCGNPIVTPFELIVSEGAGDEGDISDAEIRSVSGGSGVTIVGSNNKVNVRYSPVDSYLPREKVVETESSCDASCIALWVIGIGIAIFLVTNDSGDEGPAPAPAPQTPPQGGTGGAGNGLPEGNTN